jgi:ABC-type nitrate/sulfonate/bicarbonate transport system permease component
MRLSSLRGLIPLAVLLALWEVVGNPDAHTLPPPSRWWEALKSIEADGSLWPAVLETLELFAEALVIATAIGVTLGVALGASKTLSRALGPLLEFLRTTPAAAIVPGAILLFGVNARTEVGIVVFG